MSADDPAKVLEGLAKPSGVVKPDSLVFEIEPSKVKEAIKKLESSYGFTWLYLSNIVGTDFKDDGVIRIDYFINIYSIDKYIVLRTFLRREDPRIESILDELPGALSAECETYDLLGVVFEGNPHLRRSFFVPTDIAEKGIFPLRKDSGV